jgi:hypothetical protein
MTHQAMSILFNGDDQRAAWDIVGYGCPRIIWHRAFEINDMTAPRPLLVRYVNY